MSDPPNQPAAGPAAAAPATRPAERAFIPVRIAVLTVSDTRTLDTDKSGQTLADRIAETGHLLSARAIVRDDVAQIRRTARNWLKRDDVDVIITTGGTGLTGRDVTIEAMRALFEKEAEGFAIAFHMLSWGKIGTSTVQSRATAGVAKGKYIFCLPGSPGACRDAWDGLLKPQLDFRHMPCNFVEIMPRLDEHLRRRKG
jgi:molybdopterin adenylyltransferase